MDFLQADNEMRTFAKETGGAAFFPRFQGEYGGIFQQIHQALRNQYVLTYQPSNKAHDGTFRKIKVELVDPATGEPLPVKDEKGKPDQVSDRCQDRATKRRAKWSRRGRAILLQRACRLSSTQSRDFPRRCKSVDSAVTALLLSHSFLDENCSRSATPTSCWSTTIAMDCWFADRCSKRSATGFRSPIMVKKA